MVIPEPPSARHTAGSGPSVMGTVERARQAQAAWAAKPLRARLRVLATFRGELATGARALAATVATDERGALLRNEADTLVAEVLPLAEACRFLEREAEYLLAPRVESARARPWWLRSVRVETARAPLGVVLLIAPGNYPLFLPGVQALQALAAGNAVLWKPAPTGVACAHAFRLMLAASGLPPDLLYVLDSAPDAAAAAMDAGVDKVFLTGSSETGQAVLRRLASTLTPSVMELSGCDAVFVLPGADVSRVVDALTFGLRLNGSATCMAPRRVFVHESLAVQLPGQLIPALDQLGAVPLAPQTLDRLRGCVAEALLDGAHLLLDGLDVVSGETGSVYATLLSHVTPEMRIAREDLFAPVLSVLTFREPQQALAMYNKCPYALTASVFGPRADALRFASEIDAGAVLVNDLIVPTADPRVSFGGRGRSGFGVTRGPEGLLAMTAPRVTVEQRSKSRVAYQPTGPEHAELFTAYIQLAHAPGVRSRLDGLRALVQAAMRFRDKKKPQQ